MMRIVTVVAPTQVLHVVLDTVCGSGPLHGTTEIGRHGVVWEINPDPDSGLGLTQRQQKL